MKPRLGHQTDREQDGLTTRYSGTACALHKRTWAREQVLTPHQAMHPGMGLPSSRGALHPMFISWQWSDPLKPQPWVFSPHSKAFSQSSQSCKFPGCPREGAAQLCRGRQSPEHRVVLRMQLELEQDSFLLLDRQTREQVFCNCPLQPNLTKSYCEDDLLLPSSKGVRTEHLQP